MTVQELVENLDNNHSEIIEIRDSENWEICTTRTDRRGVIPYLKCEIVCWFPFHSLNGGICVLINDGEEREHEQTHQKEEAQTMD